ncbi:MAG: hypothetical protein RLZZ292_531 [Bacteroidota bacterium]|jgi:hypothetical protein
MKKPTTYNLQLGNLRLFLLLFFCFLIQNAVFSQDNLLFEYTSMPNGLTESQTKILAYIDKQPTTQEIYFAKLPSLGKIVENGLIVMTLPIGEKPNRSFQIHDINSETQDGYYLICAKTKESDANLLLGVGPEGYMGRIDVGKDVFEILPMGGDNIVLVKQKESMEGGTCPMNQEENQLLDVDEGYCGKDCGAATLDILILVTPEARTFLKNSYGQFQNLVLFVYTNGMNAALKNSDVQSKSVRVRAIDFNPTFQLHPSNIKFDTESALSNDLEAKKKKKEYQADIAVLLTNQNYVGDTGDTYYGYANATVANTSNKFCIVEVYALSGLTFIHEVAHQFGCLHNMSSIDSKGCHQGFQMVDLNKYTIVTVVEGSRRIPYFSNPDVSYQGYKTGAEKANNAAQLRGAFCKVASEEFAYDPITITHNKICLNEKAIFKASSHSIPPSYWSDQGVGYAPSAPLQYQWTFSLNIDFSTPFFTSPSAVCSFDNPPCPVFFVKLVTTGANGITDTDINLVECCGKITQPSLYNVSSSLSVSPNPSNDWIEIVNNSDELIKEITILNLDGQLLDLIPNSSILNNTFKLDVSTYTAGMYILNARYETQNTLTRFTVSKD